MLLKNKKKGGESMDWETVVDIEKVEELIRKQKWRNLRIKYG